MKALVTGASRGIGRATAEALIARGDEIAVVGRDEEALIALAHSAPKQVTAIVGDVTRASERDAMVSRASDAMGGLDALICAAGIARHQPFVEANEDTLRQTFEVNAFAPFLLARDAARAMTAASTSGVIVFLTSTLVDRPAPSTAAYAASKGSLTALTRALALELAPDIRVAAVSPGLVDTAMARQLRLEPGEELPTGQALRARMGRQLEDMKALHPLGRLGTPSEVASAILYLLDASWSTGTVLTLDGGLSL